MNEEITSDSNEIARQRLERLLQVLAKRGVTQSQVAARAGVPAPYLTDMKKGNRSVTELFSRRLGEAFSVDYRWILGEVDTLDSLHIGSEAGASGATSIWLPIFSHPIQGPPHEFSIWDGSSIEVVGAAAVRVRMAEYPYVLRFGRDDHTGRLRRNDLLLVSQSTYSSAEIQILKYRRKLFLFRRQSEGVWERVAEPGAIKGDLPSAGHAIGIVWAAL